MSGEIGVFKFKALTNFNNSFIFLNNADIQELRVLNDGDVVAVEIRFGPNLEKVFYSSLGPCLHQIPKGCASLNQALASKIGIKEGDELLLLVCHAVPVTVAYVRPKSDDDYRIMLNVHNVLENSVLHQVRILAPGQVILLKVGNISVDLITENINPAGRCGRLEKYTEFVVLDNSVQSVVNNQRTISQSTAKQSITDILWRMFQWGTGFLWKFNDNALPALTMEENRAKILKSAVNKKGPLDFRVILETRSSNVIITSYGYETDLPTSCRITKMTEKTAVQGTAKIDHPVIYASVKTIPNQCGDTFREIHLNKDIMEKLDVVVGSRVYVEDAVPPISTVSEKSSNSGMEKPTLIQESKVYLEMPIVSKGTDTYLSSDFDVLKERLINVMQRSSENFQSCNALIVAPAGCGKTFLIDTLHRDLSKEKFYCCVIRCKELCGKKIESLMKIWTSKWSECAYREPSALFLDDFDSLMLEDEQEEDGEMGSFAIYSAKLAALLTELAESFQNKNRLSLIATASNLKYLLSVMSATRGPRLFDLVLNIPEMTADDRGDVLKRLELEINDDVISRTQGYRIQDMLDLAAKARLHAALKESRQISLIEVEKALEDTTPMSLLGVRLHKDVPYTWDDVGGMKNVKTILDEIFRWPSQFPQVFDSCPLRLQSGALLFGSPGCGKTLVAGALANECGMNFISVKGPEVLSKYVGASEAAVRDLFDRAARAQPCLLFFDELDSLAPRRGHDTTGVTDRVVNQLLTQLDGVESRTGVWVLGASSRPDLIDPALLRPGRLDRAILCPLPSEGDRLHILQVLSRNLSVAEDVDFSELAANLENYTGADLQAVLYNSQMKAFQDRNTSDGNEELVITLRNIGEAMQETKPSLSTAERLKYDRLFKRFMNAKGPAEPPMQQRVTFL